jgi:hypothetical protein
MDPDTATFLHLGSDLYVLASVWNRHPDYLRAMGTDCGRIEGVTTNEEIDDRAAAAVSTASGISGDEAQRMVAILRKAGVLRSGIDLKHVKVEEALGKPTHVSIEFEDGHRVAGELRGPGRMPQTWNQPTPRRRDTMSEELTPGQRLGNALRGFSEAGRAAGATLTAQDAFGWMMRGDIAKARATLAKLPADKLREASDAAAALSPLADDVASEPGGPTP